MSPVSLRPGTHSEKPESSSNLYEVAAPFAVGIVVALGVVYPWVGRGWLLALDDVHGPYSGMGSLLSTGAAGQASLPISLLTEGIGHVIGYATLSWVEIAIALLIAAVSAGQVTPGTWVAKTVAAALYAVNPFVFDRIYAGQIDVVLGYAVLPWVAQSLFRSQQRSGWARWAGAGWIAADAAISVHYIWIDGVLILGLVLWRLDIRAVGWALGTILAVILLDSYLQLPEILQRPTVTIGGNDLLAFRTSADPHLGLFFNVAGLYGFWRIGPIEPKAYVAAWPVLLVVLVLVAVRGAIGVIRNSENGAFIGMIFVGGLVGFFLAMGDQGPTGPIFDLLYHHVPGFSLMREPEKFSALIAQAYAIGLGIGVESLVQAVPRRVKLGATGLALAMVGAYTPTIFGGLNGQLNVGHFPPDYTTVERIMGPGPGNILALPLHEYEAFDFTNGRVIANPAPNLFRRNVLEGGEIQAGPLQTDSTSPENSYLDNLIAAGSSVRNLGHLTAQLGIRYIVLFKTADYQSYGWLDDQTDLRLLYQSSDIALYENPLALPVGARLTSSLAVPSLTCYLRLSQVVNLTGTAVTIRSGAPCPSATTSGSPPIAAVHETSPVSYSVDSGPSGTVVVPQPGGSGWNEGSNQGITLVNGVQAFPTGTTPSTVSLYRWWANVVGDVLSALLMTTLIVANELSRRRTRELSSARQ